MTTSELLALVVGSEVLTTRSNKVYRVVHIRPFIPMTRCAYSIHDNCDCTTEFVAEWNAKYKACYEEGRYTTFRQVRDGKLYGPVMSLSATGIKRCDVLFPI